MSKAFTKESDQDEDDELPSPLMATQIPPSMATPPASE